MNADLLYMLSSATAPERNPFDKEILITMALLLTVATMISRRRKKMGKSRKEMRKLKWKMRWALLKSFFKKEDLSGVLAILLFIGIMAVLLIYAGWLVTLLLLLPGIFLLMAAKKKS